MAVPRSTNEPIRQTWTAPLCHEEVFIQRYQWLRGWALRLAGNVTDAEDLLHDAFLQFVLRRRDLSEIESIDAYLYGMLRRLRLSKRRTALRAREDPLDAVDYDTAELSLRAADPRDAMRLRDELRHVCAYGCQRKDTSRSGSVLLLRFFHGFFPREIASILKCPLRGANDWLRIARREAREHIADPARARVDLPADRSNGSDGGAGSPDPLVELREMIWAARRGECLSAHLLARVYGVSGTDTLSCRMLAHLVSCRDCLTRVTELLGMRGPIDRDPHDMLGQDTSWRFGRGSSSAAKGAGVPAHLRRWQAELQTVREHVPRELRVAANGLPLGACSVNATECAFTLAVNIDEPLDFIEVFSEQGVRLMLWEVEPAPAGDVDQADRVELEGGRSLSVAARFNGHWPSLEIAYRDPEWIAESEASATPAARVISFRPCEEIVAAPTIWSRLRAFMEPRAAWLPLSPVVSVLVLAAGLFFWSQAPWRAEPLSAAEVLADARSLEVTVASAPEVVVHRVLQLEERRLPDRAVRSRRRIEAWQSGSRQLTSRRVYDERGRLVSAEWLRGDGTRTVYAVGQPPRVERSADRPAIAAASIWQWEPSAGAFERLVGDVESAVVREEPDRYVLTYRSGVAAGSDGLIEATLVVAKDPLRPIAQTLVLRERGESREFHFAETTRAELPEARVPDSTFQPDPELLPPPVIAAPPAASRSSRGPSTRPIIDSRAAARLQVDVLFALHRLEACLDTPAEIAPAADGTLAVTVVAVSDECRGRIRRAVGPERDGARAVVTFAPRVPAASVGVSASRSELEALPGYRSMIDRFAAAGLGTPARATDRDDAAVIAARAFGVWALEHSRRAQDEVLHLERLTAKWTIEALEPLDVDRVARWQDVVRDHARRFRREAEGLRAQLGSFVSSTGAGPGQDDRTAAQTLAVRSVEDVRPAVGRLLVLAAAQHDAVRQLFDPALNAPRVPIDIGALRAGLREAEAQAAWFDEPWTMPERTMSFGIVDVPHHISMKAP